MITVDKKSMADLPTTHPARIQYETYIKEIRSSYNFPIIFKMNNSSYTYDDGLKNTRPSIIPTICTHTPQNANMPAEWRYYKNPSDAARATARTNFLITGSTLLVNANDIDFAVFLMFVLRHENDTPFFGSEYEVYSTKAAAIAEAEIRRRTADIHHHIYGSSPLAKDLKQLMKIGRSLGMAKLEFDSNLMVEENIKNEIYDFVMYGEETGNPTCNIDAFLNAFSANIETNQKAFIQECFDSKILELEEENNEIYLINGRKRDFFYRMSEFELPNMIQVIANHIAVDTEKRKKIEDVAGRSSYGEDASYTWTDIEKASTSMLKPILNKHKIAYLKTDTAEELRDKLAAALGITPPQE